MTTVLRSALHPLLEPTVIKPGDLATYLRSAGWRQGRISPQHLAVWTFTDARGEEYELLLPLRTDYRDYGPLILRLMSTLEEAEQRPFPAILSDVTHASADIIRVPARTRAVDGMVPLQDAVLLVQCAQELMLSAACATVEQRAWYHGRRSAQADRFVEGLRMDSERGSFVLKVISPVRPQLRVGESLALFPEGDEEPFERRVTLKLHQALQTVTSAIDEATLSGASEPFTRGISSGINANLCRALVKLGQATGDQQIEINLSWARSRPVSGPTRARFIIDRSALPVLEEAATILQERVPEPRTEVRGYVIKLTREPGRQDGKVTLLEFEGERPRKITMTLPSDTYEAAIKAHQDGTPHTWMGDLHKDRNGLYLKDAIYLGPLSDG